MISKGFTLFSSPRDEEVNVPPLIKHLLMDLFSVRKYVQYMVKNIDEYEWKSAPREHKDMFGR